MATQEIVVLSDSLDERIKNGVETVTFFNPLDGTKLEIELGEANQKHFASHLEKLVKYIAAAREVVETKPARKTGNASKSDLTAVREWARANGFEVGDRGRIKAEILEAFEASQNKPAEAPESASEAVEQDGPTSEVVETEQAVSEAPKGQNDDQEFIEFLKSAMDENGKISAESLAKVESV